MSSERSTTAAGIVIGDEILSGAVQDTNTPLLAGRLRQLGVELRRVVTLGDLVEEIAEEVRRCARRYDYVFTSGGVGPTHDDRTMAGVAYAFGVPVVRHVELEELVHAHWKGRVNEAALKLADVPRGARLLRGDARVRFPLVALQNVYILPGIPQLFAEKLALAEAELHGARCVQQGLYLSIDETEIADHLARVAREVPAVKIGSYPRLRDADHRVHVTVEGARLADVERALARLLELIPEAMIVRVDHGGPS